MMENEKSTTDILIEAFDVLHKRIDKLEKAFEDNNKQWKQVVNNFDK